MMKICLVPVCYNAYDDVLRFLDSIDHAFLACSCLELDVVLVDNSTEMLDTNLMSRNFAYSFNYCKSENVGYFPAFNKALSISPDAVHSYDYIIICNVDLMVSEDFFLTLTSKRLSSDVGLIAPGIISKKDGRNLNPKMMRRPSKYKIEMMRFICLSPCLFRWYGKLVRMRERARSRSHRKNLASEAVALGQSKMYGAHGSFMIFSKNYFSKGADVNYPRFLFGEEVFVAEQLRLHGLRIQNSPEIRVFDREHASTSQANFRFLCAEHRKSYDYLKYRFFSG